jgi:hypothetical protein
MKLDTQVVSNTLIQFTFVYDPLIDWTPGNEAGYTGSEQHSYTIHIRCSTCVRTCPAGYTGSEQHSYTIHIRCSTCVRTCPVFIYVLFPFLTCSVVCSIFSVVSPFIFYFLLFLTGNKCEAYFSKTSEGENLYFKIRKIQC